LICCLILRLFANQGMRLMSYTPESLN